MGAFGSRGGLYKNAPCNENKDQKVNEEEYNNFKNSSKIEPEQQTDDLTVDPFVVP